jgi:hypothetical protein
MAAEDEWILFLERNPQFFELSKGDFFIRFLEKISEGAKSFSDLRQFFPEIESDDMQTIMDSFLKLKVVSSISIGPKIFYVIAPEGKKLLNAYKKTKRFYST